MDLETRGAPRVRAVHITTLGAAPVSNRHVAQCLGNAPSNHVRCSVGAGTDRNAPNGVYRSGRRSDGMASTRRRSRYSGLQRLSSYRDVPTTTGPLRRHHAASGAESGSCLPMGRLNDWIWESKVFHSVSRVHNAGVDPGSGCSWSWCSHRH